MLLYVFAKHRIIITYHESMKKLCTYCFSRMKNDPDNPWSVKSIEEFHFYCCPECSERVQTRESFVRHALEQHPKSKEFLEEYDDEDLSDIEKEMTEDDEVVLD